MRFECSEQSGRRVRRGLRLALLACVVGCGHPPGGSGDGSQRTAPEFALKDLQGKLVRLTDSAGKIRLVDFWATWCAPCREAIPDLKALHETYKDKGLTVLAISVDEPSQIVEPFVRKMEIPYTTLLGDEKVADAFGGIVGLPTTFLIDRDGKIVDTFVGGTPKEVFESKIRALLGLGSAG